MSDEVDEDPSGSKAIWERGLLSGASQKVCGGVGVAVITSDFPFLRPS